MGLRKMLCDMDVAGVQGYLLRRSMILVPLELVASWCRRFHNRHHNAFYDEDGSCDLYLRARMTESGCYTFGCEYGSIGEAVTAVLHVASLAHEETDEQLALLRGEHQEDSREIPQGPATPGIERTNLVLTPIDRVASRVAPDLPKTDKE